MTNPRRLLPQVEFLEQVFIPVGLRLAQIIEQALAHRHHLEEAAARRMVFGMALEVFGQLPDPAGEKCDLHVRAAGILLVELELLHVHRVTAFCHKRAGIVGEESAFASAAATYCFCISLISSSEPLRVTLCDLAIWAQLFPDLCRATMARNFFFVARARECATYTSPNVIAVSTFSRSSVVAATSVLIVMMLSIRCLFARTAALMSSINFAMATGLSALICRVDGPLAPGWVARLRWIASGFSSEPSATAPINHATTEVRATAATILLFIARD